MICKKCNTENNLEAKFCKSCGIPLENTKLPLSGGDRVGVIIYFIILILTSFPIGSGAIPLVTSFVTLYLIKTNKNIASIHTSKAIITISLILASIAWGISSFYESLDRYSNHEVILFGIFSFGTLFLILLANKLFFSVLVKHQQWIIENGLFADAPKESKKQSTIIGSDNLSTFSVADELLKWNELLEKGLISKEEFDVAKQKLLQPKDS